jgi:hypothetical protein
MDMGPYLHDIHRQLEATAEAGGEEARAVAGRLVAPLESAIRLALLDVLAAAAEEITVELAPGSVELRLRGRDPEFVVSLPPVGPTAEVAEDVEATPDEGLPPAVAPPPEGDEGTVARINLRLPEYLKARIEQAAGSERLSVNSWLVRAASAGLERADSARGRERRAPHGAQRYRGWVR